MDSSNFEAIASLIISVIGGLASAYLIKKTLDALDNNKKVNDLYGECNLCRKQTQPRKRTVDGNRNMKLVLARS